MQRSPDHLAQPCPLFGMECAPTLQVYFTRCIVPACDPRRSCQKKMEAAHSFCPPDIVNQKVKVSGLPGPRLRAVESSLATEPKAPRFPDAAASENASDRLRISRNRLASA